MSVVLKDASEKQFQEEFVKELRKYRWETPDELNGNKHQVTVQDLINNWRQQLNRINADQLEGIELTDSEFNQVLTKVRNINNSYEAAKLLAMENSTGKIDGIYRDDNPEVTRKQITLTIFKKPQVAGGDSSYQVAREVVSEHGNRFDIVLLINGLPLINIEQKRTDKSLDEAVGQFKRYYRDGEYQNNFMVFSQMMVVTSEIETRYFATPKSINDFNSSFIFHWADRQNNVINEWHQVVKHFLMIPMAHQMVGDYLVIDHAKNEEDRRHMLMRPYQVYALQAIEFAYNGEDGKCGGRSHGGFIWHTTGSGKTITSFKTALVLSTRLSCEKVVFMVDRKELDSNTVESFRAYAEYEAVDVDSTSSTTQLRKKLQSKKSGIVVTTTFKLYNLVKYLEDNKYQQLAEKDIVFIIDEAQRTTMGQMMGTIKRYFRKKGHFYGFTGTPLFEENKAKGMIIERKNNSELINTTEKLFGPELHRYTIDEAIRDGNVLGFNVDYINTGEFTSYDDLKHKLSEKLYGEKVTRAQEREIAKLSDSDVEKKAREKGLLIYQDKTHIPRVVTAILNNWESQSKARNFNAILTVAYKNRVIEYYKEFRKQLDEKDQQLNIAMTFSFGNENDMENIVSDGLKEMMFKDYASFTGIKFEIGSNNQGEEAYFDDLITRAKRGGSGRNPKNIDLVIVADQLLTGYDSKRLNTLYVDRSLELQGLIQAYSRTNRIFDKKYKEFGTIINFQYPAMTREAVDLALKLYGSGGNSSRVIVDNYNVAVEKLKQKNEKMIKTLEEPAEWIQLKNNKEKRERFVKAYLAASGQLNRVCQYYCYVWDDDAFGVSEHVWKKYRGAYKNLGEDKTIDPIDEPIIFALEGRTKLQGTQVIDEQHILNLMDDKIQKSSASQNVNSEVLRIIYEEIQELSDRGEYQKAQFLKQFVDEELIKGKVPSDVRFDDAYFAWKNRLIRNEIRKFANEWGVDFDRVTESYSNYSISQERVPFIDEIIKTASKEKSAKYKDMDNMEYKMSLSETIKDWMRETKKKFE